MKSNQCLLVIIMMVLLAPSYGADPNVDPAKEEQQRQEARMVAFDEFRREYMAPIYAEKKRKRALNAGRIIPQTDSTGPLLGDDAFEKKLWQRLSADVVARRDLNKLNAEIQRIRLRRSKLALENDNVKRLAGFAECDKQLKDLFPKRDEMEDADNRVGTMVLHLMEMYDARAIRLIAPLMFENDFEKFDGGDHGSGGFTQGILERMRALKQFGVFQADWPPYDFSEKNEEFIARPLREWWMKNREQFGPVYELPKPVTATPQAPQKTEPEPAQHTKSTDENLQKTATLAPSSKAEESPAKSSWWILAVIIATLFLVALAAWFGRPASSDKQEK